MNLWLAFSGILLCMVCSAFFSSSEMAYSCCNRLRLENAGEDGEKSARLAVRIVDCYENALSAILIGNNLANIAASSLASLIVLELLGENYAWVATLVMTVLIIIFCETIPKITAKKNATNLAMKYAGITRALMVMLGPVIWVVVKLVHLITGRIRDRSEGNESEEAVEELQSLIETAEDEEVLDEDRSELLQAAIDFPDISAYEVMTARVDVEALDVDASREELLAFVEEVRYTRIPVYEGSIDNVVGILSLNKFLRALAEGGDKAGVREMMLPPCFVYKTTKLPQVLEQLKKERQHLAVVSDEYGGTLGVVSMEDVLEQIVGDIWDEEDEYAPEVVESENGSFVIDGDMMIADFLELAEIPENGFEAESETVGGWVMETLEKFPAPGDGFTYAGCELKVLQMDGRRVEKLQITKNNGQEKE